MILAINTAQPTHELCLIREKMVFEHRWESARDDLEKLPSLLKDLLEENGLDKKEISSVLIVKGPGPFSALRTGIAFGNALAFALKAQLHEVSTFDLIRLKFECEHGPLPHNLAVLLPAGGQDLACQLFTPEASEIEIAPADLLMQELRAQSNLTILEPDFQPKASFSRVLLTFGLDAFTSCTESVAPLYMKGPHITPSKDKWKQA